MQHGNAIVGGSFITAPAAIADSGDHGSAKTSSFLFCRDPHRQAGDVRLQLTPNRALGTAAGGDDRGRFDTILCDVVAILPQDEGNTFHHSACHIDGVMLLPQAPEDTGGIGIKLRSVGSH